MACANAPIVNSVLSGFKRLSFFTYSLFLLGFFFFPKAPEHYEYYYWAVLIPTAILTVCALQLLRYSALFWLILAYALYMLLAALWSDPFLLDDFLFHSRRIAYVLAFILITTFLQHEYPKQFEMLLKFGGVVSGVAAIVAIVLWYSDHPFPQSRLPGIGRMQYPIRTACAFGFFSLLAVSYYANEKNSALRSGFLLSAFAGLALILLTQSRTSLVAFISATSLLFLLQYPRQLVALAGFFLILVASVLLITPEFGELLARAMPYRPAIWQAALARSIEAPIFGHGSLADTRVSTAFGEFVHAHDAFLASFRDGGIIGLALLISILGYACLAAYRFARRENNYLYLALLVYATLCIVPNVDRLFTRPREMWLYFWLPLIFVMTKEVMCRMNRRIQPVQTSPGPG